MTPTTKLRFVEREIETNAAYGNYFVRVKVKILQQWWEPDSGDLAGVGPEWRDVPLEEEE
jgi:hypothetical protein